MFDALVNGRIDTRGLEFSVRFADIEELNRRVMSGSADSVPLSPAADNACFPSPADICKISYAVLPAIFDRYDLLDGGSALGHGNGPLLVARPDVASRFISPSFRDRDVFSGLRVAVPGIHTTADLLLQRLFPELTDRRPMLFSQIAPAIERGDVDAGVLIHEGRFTYGDYGLELVADLGLEWERTTTLPLPLGAIVASRSLPPEIVGTFEELLRESILYAFRHPLASREFVKSHARELNDDVIDSHIALFVNDNSLSLSPAALLAVKELTGVEI
jgi:1,4-dihydroxy-6-naphthoate synthase